MCTHASLKNQGDVLTVNVKVDSALSLSWEDAQHAPPPRCSTWLPRWHFDMLADAQVLIGPSLQYHAPHTTQRARAYDTAITRAVTDMRAAGNRAVVLDAGAGTGLLAMMAARCENNATVLLSHSHRRAGSPRCFAVERHASMAATAVWCVAANELSAAVTVLHADVRHLTLDAPSINGGLPISQRLPEPITVVVYEVFFLMTDIAAIDNTRSLTTDRNHGIVVVHHAIHRSCLTLGSWERASSPSLPTCTSTSARPPHPAWSPAAPRSTASCSSMRTVDTQPNTPHNTHKC